VSEAPAVFMRMAPALHADIDPLPSTTGRQLGSQKKEYKPNMYISAEIMERVGKGAIGVAYRAKIRYLADSVMEWDAVIKLAFFPHQKKQLRHEYSVYESLSASHVNGIPSVLGLFEDVMTDGPLGLVMNYGGRNLKSHFSSLLYNDVQQVEVPMRIQYAFLHLVSHIPVSLTLVYRSQLLRILSAIHKAGILHRDLRPENMVVDEDGLAAIIDFDRAVFNTEADSQDTETALLRRIFEKRYTGPASIVESSTQ